MLCKDFLRFSRHENIVLLLWGEGVLSEEMQQNGVEVINLHTATRKAPQAIRQIVKICRDRQIDAVIAHHEAILAHLCLPVIKKECPQIHTIAYAHCDAAFMCRIHDKRGLRIRKAVLARSLKKADHVVAISESVKKSLIREFATPEDKIVVIYNGVETSRFPKTGTGFHDPMQIIYVGRLIPEKGVQGSIEALAQVKDTVSFVFLVVGDGPYRGELEKLAAEKGLGESVRFLGSRRDVAQLLETSDVFLHMPECEEGFGITVVEAMAAGKVCVVADSGALPEIVTDGVNGFLVEKGNAQALARKIQEIAGKLASEEMQKIRTNAVKRAEDFSIQRYSEALDALVEGTADRRSLGGKDHS